MSELLKVLEHAHRALAGLGSNVAPVVDSVMRKHWVTVEVNPETIAHVIGSAHSGYWLDEYTYSVAGEDDSVLLVEGPCRGRGRNPKPVRNRIGAPEIVAGIGLALASDSQNIREIAARVLGGNGDGPDMDVILQFAVFGECVFG